MAKFRIEQDSIGQIKVPSSAWWGAQTQRSKENFAIGPSASMPKAVIHGLIRIKLAAADANYEQGLIKKKVSVAIKGACNHLIENRETFQEQFPLVIWQTGSGTQTNMNCNEVIAKLANAIVSGKKVLKPEGGYQDVHPNDHVNKSQSSNDVFPGAMHIAASCQIHNRLLPVLRSFSQTLKKKSEQFKDIIKIGRTHLQDATPVTLGQEFGTFHAQVEHCIDGIKKELENLLHLPLGGTAVGTGINSIKGFDKLVVKYINSQKFLGKQFKPMQNKFFGIATHDSIVAMSGHLNTAAVALHKIANDIRMLGSGPRCGLGELELPANEPGSSIMPGKVNPTQAEALTMVCAQVMGNHNAITFGGANGHFQLNAYKPVMIYNLLNSIDLLSDGVESFVRLCVKGIKPNKKSISSLMGNSLMLVTALVPKIGYDKASQIAKNAHKNGTTLKEEGLKLGLDSKTLDFILDNTQHMVKPGNHKKA